MSAPKQNQFAAKLESKKLSDSVCVNVHPKEKSLWKRSSRKVGENLSTFIRGATNERARKA